MPIPSLDETGFLPEGVHDATLPEIGATFGRFQTSDQRMRLFDRLQEYVRQLKSTDLAAALIVDGSFVTDKDRPWDIDLIVVLRKGHDLTAELRPFEYNIVSRRRVQRAFAFDLLVAREDSPEYDEYIEFFQRIKGQEGRKGLLRVLL
jgi:hypothetical protein